MSNLLSVTPAQHRAALYLLNAAQLSDAAKNDGNIIIIYGNNNNVHHIRLNGTYPWILVPLPMGDWSVERYRLIDGVLAKAAQEKVERAEGAVGTETEFSGIDPDTSLKGLQLELTMEDRMCLRRL